MRAGRRGAILDKVAFGIAGFIVGAYAGFWIVALLADAMLSPPAHRSSEPMTGMGSGLAGLFIGAPVGAVGMSVLAVASADTLASWIAAVVKRLRRHSSTGGGRRVE